MNIEIPIRLRYGTGKLDMRQYYAFVPGNLFTFHIRIVNLVKVAAILWAHNLLGFESNQHSTLRFCP